MSPFNGWPPSLKCIILGKKRRINYENYNCLLVSYNITYAYCLWFCFQVVGTYGYAAPEYIETGHLSTHSDLWSFGVVLYEILTGRRVLDKNRPPAEQKLLYWVKQFPADGKRFSMIIDPLLRGQYSLTAARKLAKLADSCLNKNAKDRPTMSEVVEVLKQALQDSEAGTSSENRSFEASGSKLAKRKPK